MKIIILILCLSFSFSTNCYANRFDLISKKVSNDTTIKLLAKYDDNIPLIQYEKTGDWLHQGLLIQNKIIIGLAAFSWGLALLNDSYIENSVGRHRPITTITAVMFIGGSITFMVKF